MLSSRNLTTRSSRSSGRKSSNRKSVTETEIEEDEDLSADSDDDPSWGPKTDKNKNKEADIVQNFIPRKRKRIGPDEIGVKKVKKNVNSSQPTPTPPVSKQSSVTPILSKPSSILSTPATGNGSQTEKLVKSKKPRGRPSKKVRITEPDSETSSVVSTSDNDDLMDVSEENNRIEG